jgi:predicted small secreted protein
MRHRVLRICVLVALAVVLTACAAEDNPLAGRGEDPAGFWLGLWHGFITPVTFIVSLFNDGVGIYEVRNNGGWYDFGFVFGLSVIFGGMGRSGAAASSSGPRSKRRS